MSYKKFVTYVSVRMFSGADFIKIFQIENGVGGYTIDYL